MGRPNLCRETQSLGANGDSRKIVFPVQLPTSRIGNLTYPVDPYSAECFDHRVVPRVEGRGDITILPRGCHQNSTSRGQDYIIPYMFGKLALN